MNIKLFSKPVNRWPSHLKKLLILPIGLLAACSSSFDHLLFSLVPHPQEPKQRPYEIRAVEFINPKEGTKIAGELTYPSSGGDFPAFVLISGHSSGDPPAARNSIITGHKYFLVLSHLLTMRGYAVLRFDNRGVGQSEGEYENASDDDFASDAAAALTWLRERSGVTLSSSGFLGHSQGATKAFIAAEQENPDFIVSLAGGVVGTVAEAVIQQYGDIHKATGVSPSKSDQTIRELTDIFEILRVSEDREQARSAIRNYAIEAGVKNEKKIQKLVDNLGSVWWFTEAHRETEIYARNFDGPVLALFGSKDLLVSSEIQEAPTRALLHHPQSEVITFEGLNHLFQKAKKGTGFYEYWEIETTIEEEVIETIDAWMNSVLNNPLQQPVH